MDEYIVSNDIRDRYVKDGAIVLRSVVSQEWIEKLREVTRTAMLERGATSFDHEKKETKGRFFEDQMMWKRDDLAREFLFEGPLAKIAACLMTSNKVRIFYDHILVKEPGVTTPTPWHNDMSYWHLKGDQICSMWLALDPVVAETCVKYLRGSHTERLHHRVTSFAGEDTYTSATAYTTPVPDVEGIVAQGRGELLGWDLNPGDVIVHHGYTIHGAPGNNMASLRRGYVTRWLGDDIRFDARPGTINPGWVAIGYDNGLKDGDRMECDLHPTIYAS